MANLSFLFAGTAGEIHPLIVCVIGVGVVFIGLACIIGLVELMTLICNKLLDKSEMKKSSAPANAASAPTSSGVIENRSEILAAVCAAVAEEEGTDISAIRVISFKKL